MEDYEFYHTDPYYPTIEDEPIRSPYTRDYMLAKLHEKHLPYERLEFCLANAIYLQHLRNLRELG